MSHRYHGNRAGRSRRQPARQDRTIYTVKQTFNNGSHASLQQDPDRARPVTESLHGQIISKLIPDS